MELRIEIDDAVVEWLASMGYPVKGTPVRMLRGMLLREALQWEVSPEALQALMYEGAGTRGAADPPPSMRPASYGFIRIHDRPLAVHH